MVSQLINVDLDVGVGSESMRDEALDLQKFKEELNDEEIDGDTMIAQMVNVQLVSQLSDVIGSHCTILDTATNKHHAFCERKFSFRRT